MKEIPTAEEFLEQWCNKRSYVSIDEADDIEECLKEFAQLHVEAALKKAHQNMQLPEEDLEFTLSAYPKENIK